MGEEVKEGEGREGRRVNFPSFVSVSRSFDREIIRKLFFKKQKRNHGR